jgi:hypothetical protein
MAELPKEELIKIADANRRLVTVAETLALSTSTEDKAAPLIQAQIKAMLDIARDINSAVTRAR